MKLAAQIRPASLRLREAAPEGRASSPVNRSTGTPGPRCRGEMPGAAKRSSQLHREIVSSPVAQEKAFFCHFPQENEKERSRRVSAGYSEVPKQASCYTDNSFLAWDFPRYPDRRSQPGVSSAGSCSLPAGAQEPACAELPSAVDHGPALARCHAPSPPFSPSDTGQSPAAPVQTRVHAAYTALPCSGGNPSLLPGKGTSRNIWSWLPSATQKHVLQVFDKCSLLSMNAAAVLQKRH